MWGVIERCVVIFRWGVNNPCYRFPCLLVNLETSCWRERAWDTSSPCTIKTITHGRIIGAWNWDTCRHSLERRSVTCRRPRQARVAGATVTRAIQVDAPLHAKYCTDTLQRETHPIPSYSWNTPSYTLQTLKRHPSSISPSTITHSKYATIVLTLSTPSKNLGIVLITKPNKIHRGIARILEKRG